MTKRAANSDLSKNQPHAELSSEELLAYQKVMRGARKPKLDEDKKLELRQIIDHHAQQGKSFSKMTVERCEQRLWWWRYLDSTADLIARLTSVANQGGEFTVIADPTVEGREMMVGYDLTALEIAVVRLDTPRSHRFPAFVYEMGVRLAKPDLIATPWIKLPLEDRLPFLDALMRPNFLTGIVREEPLDDDSPERWHWTRPVGNLRFNLLHSDTRLQETFLTIFIQSERRRLKIPSTKPESRETKRSAPWFPIEAYDRDRFDIDILNDSERSNVYKGKKKVSDLLDIPIPDARAHKRAIRRKA